MKEAVWQKSYDRGVPTTLKPYPGGTVLDEFADAAKRKPKHPCLVFKADRYSYEEVDRLTDAMAAALASKDVHAGDTVALLLPNCPEAVIGQIGTWKAGGIAVPLNPLYTAEELENGINQSGATVAIVYSTLYPVIKSFQSRHPRLRLVIPVQVKGYSYKLDTAVAARDREILVHPDDAWLHDLLKRYAGQRPVNIKVGSSDVALILQSGGTTGTPRGIMLTHGALLTEATQLRAWLKSVLADWDNTIMLNLPLFHVFGNAAGLCTGIVAHSTMALVPDPRDHGDILDTIQKVKPVLFAGVPTLFSAISSHPAVIDKKIDFSSVKVAVSGAAPLSQQVRDRFTLATGIRLIQGYGLTETSAAVIAEPLGKQGKTGSIGLPLPDVQIKIVDSETGKNEVTPGREGELLIKCPQVMLGFWNSLEETEEMLRDGWLHTGDIGYMDKEGYIFVTARKKELIKVSGFQVWPNEIIQVIKSLPAVADVCVRGIPDPVQGESVKAWIVLHKGMELSEDELKAYCRTKLTAYKVPRYVEFRQELPSSLSGQKLCRILVEEEKAKVASRP
jgi:long-chain acyl-CoA synthetase